MAGQSWGRILQQGKPHDKVYSESTKPRKPLEEGRKEKGGKEKMKKIILILTLLCFMFLGVSKTDASMYDMVNTERKSNNLPALKVDKQLEKNATKRACEIKEWSHKGWTKYFVKVKYTLLGENLSKDFNDLQAMKAFMASPTHRENILEKRFTSVGVGYCGKYIVQHFGGYVKGDN